MLTHTRTARSFKRPDALMSAMAGAAAAVLRPARLAVAKTALAYRTRKAVAEVQGLDDRVLRDMGVSRNDINTRIAMSLSRSHAPNR